MADIVNIQLNTKVVTFGVRVTTLHLLIGGAIAAGVLYLVNELVRATPAAPGLGATANQPTPITRAATP